MSNSAALGEERTVEVPAGTIAYREAGQGPAIVFLHGLFANGDHWRHVAPPLAERGFRCIVPDLPLGSHRIPMTAEADLSPVGLASIVDSFLAALDLSDVTLVANDTGGAIAQVVVTRHPDRIGKLVLAPCDAFDVFLPTPFKWLEWMSHVPGAIRMIGQTMRFRPLRRTPMAYGWLAKRPMPNEVTDGYLEPVWHNAGARRDVRKVLSTLGPRYTEEAARRLSEFKRPVLLAWALEDRVFPFEWAGRLQQLFPNATVEAVEDSYAFIPEDQPERLVELVAAFAASR
jgi:pimeloyl-ACP methyl ester carboxylesterase